MTPEKSSLFVRLLQTQQRRANWIRIVCILAVAVIFGVINALMMRAETMEDGYVCGMEEHIHSEECYEVQDEQTVPVCGLQAHTHDERCCLSAQDEQEPVAAYYCGFDYEHWHTPSCYADGALICTLHQHEHTAACFDPSAPPPAEDAVDAALMTEQNEEDPDAASPVMQEPEPTDDPAPIPGGYENIRDQEDANISLSFRVNDKEVDPNHFYDQAAYTLSITNVELPSYDGTIFYCTLDSRGYDLFVGERQSLIAMQELSQEQPGSTESVYFWADKSADGFYTIYILPKPGTEIVYKVLISGLTVSHLERTALSVNKDSQWDSENIAYRYHITANIPAYGNFQDQAYTISDRTSIASELSYSPFAPETRGKDFSVTIRVGDRSAVSIYPIEDVWQEPNAQIAYYERNGVLYLMNRTAHSGSCLTESPTEAYSGWCTCWAQEEDSVVHISYVDTYAQRYYQQYPNKTLSNRVSASDHSGEVTGEVQNPVPAVLNKEFSPISKQCTLTVNESLQELHGEIQIIDSMEGAYFDGDLSVTATNDTETKQLQANTDYILQETQDGFILTIWNAGRYTYHVTYQVGKQNPENVRLIPTNTVRINNTFLYKSIDMSFAYKIDSDSYGCEISIIKAYGNGSDDDGAHVSCANPPEGAEFGLFSSSGVLLATSKTREGIRYIETAAGKLVKSSQTAYVPGAERDVIFFNTEAGIRSGRLFYVQELAAPRGYLADETKYYFFVTSYPEADTIAVPITSFTDGIQVYDVEVFDNWELVPNPNNSNVYYYFLSDKFMADLAEREIYNERYLYILPETGGAGVLPFLLVGFCLLLLPCLYVLHAKRRARRICFFKHSIGNAID